LDLWIFVAFVGDFVYCWFKLQFLNCKFSLKKKKR
jgi:hypothetical protein